MKIFVILAVLCINLLPAHAGSSDASCPPELAIQFQSIVSQIIGENYVGDSEGTVADEIANVKALLAKIQKMLDENLPIPGNIIKLMKELCTVVKEWPSICPEPEYYQRVKEICTAIFPSFMH